MAWVNGVFTASVSIHDADSAKATVRITFPAATAVADVQNAAQALGDAIEPLIDGEVDLVTITQAEVATGVDVDADGTTASNKPHADVYNRGVLSLLTDTNPDGEQIVTNIFIPALDSKLAGLLIGGDKGVDIDPLQADINNVIDDLCGALGVKVIGETYAMHGVLAPDDTSAWYKEWIKGKKVHHVDRGGTKERKG